MKTRELVLFPITWLVLALVLLACDTNPIVPRAPSVSQSTVLFKAPEAVVAMATDGEENLYALTVGGTLLKVTPDGKSQEVAADLQTCGFSFPVLAALPDGTLVTNDCVDDKDTLVRIDQSGNKVTWLQLEQNVQSIAADAAGTLYLGTWSSVGNLTVNFQPTTYLAGADQLNGQVQTLGQDGQLTTLYKGGIPLAVAVGGKGQLYAALWGQEGAFSAESKSYSMCGSVKHFWITLSEQVQLQQVAPEQKPMDSGLVAVSYIGAGPDYLLAFGMPAGGDCGIYQVTAGQGPRRVVFEDEHITDHLTAMLVSERNLYFGDADGNVYRMGLDGLAVASAAELPSAASSPTARPERTAAPPATATPFVPEPTATPTEVILSLPEALDQGLVDLRILGTGAASGNSITIVARRVGEQLPKIRLDPGTVLVSSVGSEQDMVVRRLLGWRIDEQEYTPADFITLYGPTGSSQDYAVEAYCLDFHKDNPHSDTTFSLGGPPPADVLAVLKAVDQVPGAGEDVTAIQVAIWVVTNDLTEAEAAAKGYQPSSELVQAILRTAGLDPACYRYFGGSCSTTPAATAPVSLPPAPASPTVAVPPLSLRVTRQALLEDYFTRQVAFSPDGRYLVVDADKVYVWDAQTLERVYVFDRIQSVSSLAFSPDGQLLATASSDGVVLWSTDGWSEVRTLAGSKETGSVAFSPDGQLLATATGDTVKLWEVATGQELRTLPAGSATVVAFAPDGLTVVAGGGTAGMEIKRWEVATGKELAPLTGHSNWITCLAFSPDGKQLASGSVDQTIRLWDVAAGRQVRVLSGHSDDVTSVAFSPDSRLLASVSWDLTVKLWDVASGKELVSLTGHSGELHSVTFSPDGAVLVSAGYDQAVRLWGVSP